MDLLIAGFETIARVDVMIALLVGSIGGVIIGAIPGVGPAVAIAILLPATFSLDPIVGLTLLQRPLSGFCLRAGDGDPMS